MRVKLGLIAASGVLAVAGVFAAVLVAGASAHSNPCHSQHTCPSDHHTYVWTDPTTGLQWDCVEPGAPEYNPILDVTTIVWDGRTYYCRAAGSTTTTTTVTTSTTLPTTATEPTNTLTTTTTTPAPAVVLPIRTITPGALNPRARTANSHGS